MNSWLPLPGLAVKNSLVPLAVRLATLASPLLLIAVICVVPPDVPSLCQSSIPCVPSVAAKYSFELTTTRSVGLESPGPGLMSSTRVAVLPLLLHSSLPLTPSVAAKNMLPLITAVVGAAMRGLAGGAAWAKAEPVCVGGRVLLMSITRENRPPASATLAASGASSAASSSAAGQVRRHPLGRAQGAGARGARGRATASAWSNVPGRSDIRSLLSNGTWRGSRPQQGWH